MAYFDGVKTGDKVWHFEYGWGKVKNLLKASDLDNQNFNINNDFDLIEVNFDNIYFGCGYFDFDGVAFYSNGNQTLFWDEVKFEIPKKPKIKLKEDNFIIQFYYNKVEELDKPVELGYLKTNGLTRNNKETAEKAFEAIRRFTRLLALRDQECHDSRGFEFEQSKGRKWRIEFDTVEEEYYVTGDIVSKRFDVYFKTEEDAKKICDILNSRKFDLEGE